MSLESIETLAGQFESSIELQKYCDNQFLVIQKCATRIKQLESEVEELKSLLANNASTLIDSKVELIRVPPEQIICEIQISKLHTTAMARELTLEETKRLDLLVKNLQIIKASNPSIPAEFAPVVNITEAQLVEIASIADPQPESD